VKERLDAVSKRLTMDDHGVLTLDGIRTLILPAVVLTALEDAAEWLLGQDLGVALYAAGQEVGKEIGSQWKPRNASDTPTTMYPALLAEVAARGFGQIEVVAVDLAAGTTTVRLRASPYADRAEGARESACLFPAGFLAGALGTMTKRNFAAKEVQCKGKGGDFCEFELTATREIAAGGEGTPTEPTAPSESPAAS